jgi:endogenous inhibitor of DNA gyrase (YacG/DUF329 family)
VSEEELEVCAQCGDFIDSGDEVEEGGYPFCSELCAELYFVEDEEEDLE